MTAGGARATVEKCPFCGVAVRRDRLEIHAKNVHPGRVLDKAVLRRLRQSSSGSRKRRNDAGLPKAPWSTRRWILLGVGVAILVLVLYAILHIPPAAQAQVGKPAPDFTFNDLSGTSHSLSSYQGQRLVLWWIAAFCSSCSQGTQYFAQSYASQYHTAGVLMLEIEDYNDLGQPEPSLSSFASQNGYSGQAGWILGEGSSQGTNAYNPNGYLDVYYVISAQGSIVASGQGLSGSFSSALQQAVSS